MRFGEIVNTTAVKVMNSPDNKNWIEFRAQKAGGKRAGPYKNRFVFVFLGMHEGDDFISSEDAEQRMNALGWRRMTKKEVDKFNAKAKKGVQ